MKLYIIKNLSPWMMDELLSMANEASFDVLLMRAPDVAFAAGISTLKTKGVRLHISPRSWKGILRRSYTALKYLVLNLRRFVPGYNAVIGITALRAYMFLDDSILVRPLSIHAQFATQAAILADIVRYASDGSSQYYFTFHAYDIYFDNKWLKLLLRNCESAFSISEYNISYVKNRHHLDDVSKIMLSRLGAKYEGKSKQDFSENTLVFGFLGWFVEKKGLSYLLDAFSSDKVRELDVMLVIAGDGPLKRLVLSRIQKNGDDGKIRYIGPKHGHDKENFYSSIDVFVLPSITLEDDMDGIPVVLMEAISIGVPIVSTDVSGIPEICRNMVNGLLIPEKNTEALIEAIQFLESNHDVLTKLSAGAVAVSKEFDIEANSKAKLEMLGWS